MAADGAVVAVAPGDRLGAAADYEAGPGTYVRAEAVVASLAGIKQLVASPAPGARPALHVVRPTAPLAVVPSVGSRVLARITRITQLQASADILVVDGTPCAEPFHGVIRKENVREKEIDKVKIEESFKPGDVVKAEVVALGTQRLYALSTATLDLGVVHARSEEGGDVMVPVSFEEMEVPGAGVKEKRKVAKPEV
jgi:exosome complex component CSL4